MNATLPGARVHRLLAAWLDRDTLTHLVEPTVADLQHEAAAAPTRWTRAIAMLAGYAALARIVIVCELNSSFVSPRGAAIVVMGIGGAALEAWSRRHGMDGRIGTSAMLLPTFLAPIFLLLFERRRSFWQLFVTSAAAGLVTWVAFDVFISFLGWTAFKWHVVRLANGAAITLIASALAAAALWNPIDVCAPAPRRTLTSLCYASVATTAVFLAVRLVSFTYSMPFAAMLAPFFVMIFALILAVTALPPVLIARRWIRSRSLLAVVAMVCCPAPIVGSAMVDGESVARALATCLPWSGAMPLMIVPYVTGMATLGWLLGGNAARAAAVEVNQ